MNMYVVTWDTHTHDLIICINERAAKTIALRHHPEGKEEILKFNLLDDTLQTITRYGLKTIREIIEICKSTSIIRITGTEHYLV